jgi:Ran GTPase-activating protein (RanGAP) involved in mRNA processing and transport
MCVGPAAIANAIKDNGAMTSINVESNSIPAEKKEGIYQVVRMNKLNIALSDKSLTELNVSGIGFGVEGVKAVAQYISDNGAMTKIDISLNDIRAEAGKALVEGLRGNQLIKQLNFSGNNLGYNSNGDTDTSGIIAIADVIPGMAALSKFNVSGNDIRSDGAKALAHALQKNSTLTELNLESNNLPYPDLSGVIALADVIKDMGAMTSLNLAENYMGADGAKHIAAAIKVIRCVLALILTLFSCPSDFLFNCWCLLLSAGHGGTIKA